jgi:L-threonylcarbamoyladenylate synthase
VLASLAGLIPLILDGGPTAHGLESTIVAATGEGLRLLRPGPIAADLLGIAVQSASAAVRIEAPGQLLSHYAPAKPLRLDTLAPTSDEWMIGFGDVAGQASLSEGGDLIEAAANLFDRLHEADAQPLPRIAIAPIPARGIGTAINDRLQRAAAPRSEPSL